MNNQKQRPVIDPNQTVFTRAEAAAFCRCSTDTIADDCVPYVALGKKRSRLVYLREDLMAYLRSRRVSADGAPR